MTCEHGSTMPHQDSDFISGTSVSCPGPGAFTAADNPPALLPAAEVLESAAIGDEGAARQRTLVRLVMHATGAAYDDAGLIALHALRNSCRRGVGIHGDTDFGWEERVAAAVAVLGIQLPTGRGWTPSQWDGACGTIHVKRCCNGCGELIGDVTDEEINLAVAGRPLPDVRRLCGCLAQPQELAAP